MADRSACIIEIGGELPRRLFDTFAAAAEEDNALSDDWNSRPEYDRYIEEAAAGGGPLRLTKNEAVGGMFEWIENCCQVWGLPFRRRSDGCGGAYPSEIVSWFPGMEAPLSVEGSTDSPAAAPLETLRGMHRAGKTLADVLVEYDAALRPLPPFRIV